MSTTIPVPDEYKLFDFGFSGVDTPDTPPVQTPVVVEQSPQTEEMLRLILDKLTVMEQNSGDETETELREKIRKLEAMIIPLLNNLLKTADKDYIYWPNRKEVIEKQIQSVLQITRG